MQSVKNTIYQGLKSSCEHAFCQKEEDGRKIFGLPVLQKARQLFSEEFLRNEVLRKFNAAETLGASKKALCATEIFFGFTKIALVVTEIFLRAAEEKPKSSHFLRKKQVQKKNPDGGSSTLRQR